MAKVFKQTVIAAFVLAIFSGGMVYAAPMPVKVDKVQGSVEVRANDTADWKTVKDGESVSVGASIRTKADSSCMLKWAQGNILKVSALSIIKVSEADKSASGQEKSSLDIKEGKVFAHVKKLGDPGSKFELRTPTAVAGVRGTDLYGMMAGGNSSFGVTEGSVAVEAGGNEVMVEPGLSVNIDDTGAISDPAPIPEDIKVEVQQNIQEIKEEAKSDETASASETKEEKKEEKAEAKEETPAAETTSSEDATNTIDQVLDNKTNEDIIDNMETQYRTGTVEVEINISGGTSAPTTPPLP